MALNNYANLKTSIANWLGRTDLVNDIPDFITLAENDFNAKFVSAGYNKMINFLDFDADAETEALPTGFLGANAVYINASPKVSLQYVTPNQAFDMYGSSVTGQPVAYTILNDKIHFYPIPSGTYSVRMYYYKKFDALSGDTDTNDILNNHSDCYLFGALYFANTFIRGIDPNIVKEWLNFYNNAIERVVSLNETNKYNQDVPLILRGTTNTE